MKQPICGHCLRPMRGHAQANGVWLCHPDVSHKDCYRLVTLYDHPKPCSCTGQPRSLGSTAEITPERWHELVGGLLDAVLDSGNDMAEVRRAVADTYTAEGQRMWWANWEAAGPAHRRTMENSLLR